MTYSAQAAMDEASRLMTAYLEARTRIADVDATLRKWREAYMLAESDPYREFVSIPMAVFDRLLNSVK